MIGAGVFAAFAPAAAGGGQRAAARPRARRRRRVLQRDLVRPARGAVPDLRRHVRLRPRAARRVVGLPGRLGLRDRQDRARAPRWRSPSPSYAVPGSLHLQRAVALLAVLALTAVNLRGITRTARARAGARRALDRVARSSSSPRRRQRQHRDGAPRRSAVRHRRRHGISPVGRAALLRVRRLRAHRHARRGGARARADHPPRDPDRARHRRRRSTRSSRSRRCLRRAPTRSLPRRAARDGRRRGRRGLGRRRSSGSAPRSRASARCSPWSPGSGGRASRWRATATCRAGSPSSIRGTRCRTTPSSRSAPSSRARADDRPARRRSASRRSACSSTTRSRTRPPGRRTRRTAAGRAG